MTEIEKTLLNDRQSSDAAVTAIIGTAVAAATAMTVPAATAVVLGPAASTIAATAVADNGRCWITAVAGTTLAAARNFSATSAGFVLLFSPLQVSGAVTRLTVYRAAPHNTPPRILAAKSTPQFRRNLG